MQNIPHYFTFIKFHQDGRVVKALDLSSNGRMSAWVRTPLLVALCWGRQSGSVCSYVSDAPWLPTRACCAIKPRTDNWAQAKSSVQFPRQWTIKTRAGFDGASVPIRQAKYFDLNWVRVCCSSGLIKFTLQHIATQHKMCFICSLCSTVISTRQIALIPANLVSITI